MNERDLHTTYVYDRRTDKATAKQQIRELREKLEGAKQADETAA